MRLLVIAIIFLISIALVNAIHIDEKVISKLRNTTFVPVIIMLKDEPINIRTLSISSNRNFIEAKKIMVKRQQEKVLASLNYINKNKLIKIKSLSIEFKLKYRYTITNALAGEISLNGFNKLKNNPYVKGIYFDEVKHIFLDESVPLINASQTWGLIYNNLNLTGRGQTVCILDTGINYTHPALGSCTNESFLNGSCDKVISGYDFINNDPDPMDDSSNGAYSHGTHVAGIVASTDETYRGVAYEAKLIAIKVCNATGSCDVSAIINGIEWCTYNASKFNISVISMSLGGGLYSSYCNTDPISPSINNAVAQGISVVIATGNSASTTGISSPACIENATPVGAVYDANLGSLTWSPCNDSTTYADKLTCFTNRGSGFPEMLLAPGAIITSTEKDGTFIDMSGTSMATPHVAGVIALLKQYNNSLQPWEIEQLLNKTGKKVYDSETGLNFSRVDVYAAIAELDKTAPNITIISPENRTNSSKPYIFINISVNEVLSTAILEWNNSNETMESSGLNWYKNKTINSTGVYSYRIYAKDLFGNVGVTGIMVFQYNNSPPNITSFYPPEPTVSIIEPANQTFNISYIEPDNDSVSITWYRNGTIIASNTTYTFTSNYFSAGIYNITVIVSDGILTDKQEWKLIVNDSGCIPPVNISLINGSSSLCPGTYSPKEIRMINNNINLICNNTILIGNTTGYGITFSNKNSITIKNCVLKNYSFGFFINSSTNISLINNTIINHDEGVRIVNSFNSILINNLIKNNTKGIYLSNATAIIVNNSIHNNSYNIYNSQNLNISAEYNYWYYINASQIQERIYDYRNNSLLGIVDFDPWCLNMNCTSDSDYDNDGYSNSSFGGTDCNDSNATINPGVNEICDGIDNNCNNLIDENFRDLDQDGLAYCIDLDDDNDGIPDENQTLIGNVSYINSTIPIKLLVNGTTNFSKNITSTVKINITDIDNNTLIEFNWNFSKSKLIINWSIIYVPKNASLLIKNLNLNEGTKTVYLNKSNPAYNYVCIIDKEVETLTMTSSCAAQNEVKVPCSGTNAQYNCVDLGTRFKVSGLNHSAIKAIHIPSTSTPTSSGGGGGGGGGGGFIITTNKSCIENWVCTSWSPCINGTRTRSCFDINKCGSSKSKPKIVEICVVKNATKKVEISEVIIKNESIINKTTPISNKTITTPSSVKPEVKKPTIKLILFLLIVIGTSFFTYLIIFHIRKY